MSNSAFSGKMFASEHTDTSHARLFHWAKLSQKVELTRDRVLKILYHISS